MLDCPEEILYNPRSAGPLAQWLEQATHNRLVAGSSPAGATKFYLLNQHIEASFQGGFFVYPSNPPSLFLSSYKNLKFFC